MQNRLLSAVLFLLSPHFGMFMTFAMLESVQTFILVFFSFWLLNMLLVGVGYLLFMRLLPNAFLKMDLTFKRTKILVIIAIFVTASLSYFNMFALVGLIPAIMTAIASDFIQSGLKRHHYEAHLSMSDLSYQEKTASYQPRRFVVMIWFIGIIIAGSFSSWVFFVLTTDQEFALLMTFIGGLSAFFVGSLILACRFCIKKWNLPML